MLWIKLIIKYCVSCWITDIIKLLFSLRKGSAIAVPHGMKFCTLAYCLAHILALNGWTCEERFYNFLYPFCHEKNSPYFLCVLLSYICKHKTSRHSFSTAYLCLKFSTAAIVVNFDHIRLVSSVSFRHSGSQIPAVRICWNTESISPTVAGSK